MNTIRVRHGMRLCLSLVLAAAVLPLLFAACGGDAHEGEYPLAAGQGGLVVGLRAPEGTGVEGLALYFFGGDGAAAMPAVYADPRELASACLPVPAGPYTLVVVGNAGLAALPRETTVPGLVEWLREHAADCPGLLTASAQVEVRAGEVERLRLLLEEGTGGISFSTVRLSLALPGTDLPAYARSADGAGKALRCVAEVYDRGTGEVVHRRVQACAVQADGTWLAELFLLPGDYDLCLWADWDGGYYDADDLTRVTLRTGDYAAGGETDAKDAYYAAGALSVSGETGTEAIALERPFARYRLVADDAEAYRDLMAKGEALPPVEALVARVTYEGFFPTTFDVAEGKPTDALNTGIHYTSVPTAAEGEADGNLQVGADWVLTNGGESFVTLTVEMLDSRTGEVVGTVEGVRVDYRRGHLTTVTGHFLTAGRTSGGVQVEHNWGNDVTVEF